MSYVQTPSLSWLSQACEPDASGVVSGAMSDALIRVEPSSMPRMALTRPDQLRGTIESLVHGQPRSTRLAVGGARPMLAPEVTVQEGIVDRSGLGIELERQPGHRGDRLERDGVRERIPGIRGPR